MDRNQTGMKHSDIPASINTLTERVIGLAMEVHSVLGPGLLERLYEEAMVYELEQAGIPYERQLVVRVPYKGTFLSTVRLDLAVDRTLILELKSVDRLPDWEAPQLLSQMRAAQMPVGLIINFHHAHLRDGLTRRINPLAIPSPSLSPRTSMLSETSAFPPSEAP